VSQLPRLVQLVYSFLLGGSESLARDLALGLEAHQFGTAVCAVDLDGPLRAELVAAGVPAYVMHRRPGFDWQLPGRLYRVFRAEKADLVQTHHLTQLIYGVVAARLAGARVVHVEHECYTLRSAKARRHLRLLTHLCDAVVAVSEEVADFLVRSARLPRASVHVIRNGVDLRRYVPEARRPRAVLGLPPGTLLGHVARLDTAKDQPTLLHAFARVRRVHDGARLVIVGEGPQREALLRMTAELGLADRVHFLGARRDVSDLLPHFHAFVLSSIAEGLPLAMLESMACARPVIATSVGSIPDVIEHARTGLLVGPGDVEGIADAMAALLAGPAWAAALGLAARVAVAARFSFDLTLAGYDALYRRILGDKVSVDRTGCRSARLNRSEEE
jgi:glycosyltransferase involved in cell wall biosynthesis